MKCVDVIGYEGLYKVYENGDVYSCISNKILKQSKTSSGYKFVCLYKNKVKKQKTVHRIVIESFTGFMDMVVDHLDKDKTNNNLSNLQYCSQRDNCHRFFKDKSKLPVGISINKSGYEVHKYFKGEQIFIGSFDTLKEAIKVNMESNKLIDEQIRPKEYRRKDRKMRGIYFESSTKKWKVVKFLNKKKYYLGSFFDLKDAKSALDEFNQTQDVR